MSEKRTRKAEAKAKKEAEKAAKERAKRDAIEARQAKIAEAKAKKEAEKAAKEQAKRDAIEARQAKIAEAKALHESLSDLYARITIDPKEVGKTKEMLSRAYTYYKEAADEVKEHGQFVFEDTDRYQSYVSDYLQHLSKLGNRAASRNEAEDSAEAETETETEASATA